MATNGSFYWNELMTRDAEAALELLRGYDLRTPGGRERRRAALLRRRVDHAVLGSEALGQPGPRSRARRRAGEDQRRDATCQR